jgi:pimeloyl-ACP methyl ester carboxylesterase
MFYNYQNLNIHYETLGNGQDIIFLHGWGSNSEIFKPIIKDIKNKYKITLIDLPGFGKSTINHSIKSIIDVSNLIIDFINKNKIINPILIGHSYGGRIASYIATKIKVNKLILIDSAGIKQKSILKTIKIYIYKLRKKIYKITKQVMKYNNLINNSGSKDYKAASSLHKAMLKEAVNTDLRPIFKQIECETLIIWGINDQTTKLKDARIIQKLIRNSALIIIPSAGHFPFLENQYYFLKVFNNYLGA